MSLLAVCFYRTKGGDGRSGRRRQIFSRRGYSARFIQSHGNTKCFPRCQPKCYHGFDAFLSTGHQTLDFFVSHNFRGWYIYPWLSRVILTVIVNNYLISSPHCALSIVCLRFFVSFRVKTSQKWNISQLIIWRKFNVSKQPPSWMRSGRSFMLRSFS